MDDTKFVVLVAKPFSNALGSGVFLFGIYEVPDIEVFPFCMAVGLSGSIVGMKQFQALDWEMQNREFLS